jgi:hypothetical protein
LRRAPNVQGAPYSIETLADDVHLITIQPEQDSEVIIRSGVYRDRLDLKVVYDLEPILFLVDDAEGDARGRLSLKFTADDDYGIEQYKLEYIALKDDGEIDGIVHEVEISSGNVTSRNGEGVQTATIDLSRSILAGRRTQIRLIGIDGAGQIGATEPIKLTLPQRVFLQPLARSIAAERQNFLAATEAYLEMPQGGSRLLVEGLGGEEPHRRIERAPAQVQRLAMALNAVSDAPTRYFDDPILFMGMRTAMREVRRAREVSDLAHMDEDLWQMALRAELGTLADAEQALQAAQQALADAMARGADQIEMSALFDAYDEAVDRYMQALAREAAQAGRFANGSGNSGAFNLDMIQGLIDAIREATELGDNEGARRAMQQLAELLANMQMTLTRGGQGENQSPREQALQDALEELSDAISEQRSIMEETFQAGQDEGVDGDEGSSGNGEMSGPEWSELAERQGALGDSVDEQRDADGSGGDQDEMNDALGNARRAMRDAEGALDRGAREDALIEQNDALSALREASRETAEQLEAERQARGAQDDDTDPLGRGQGEDGEGTLGDGELNSDGARQRARAVLEELRRRAAERGRTQEELDYIDRLLDRF